MASLQTKEQEAHLQTDEAEDKLKAMVTKVREDATEFVRLRPALNLARCALENE